MLNYKYFYILFVVVAYKCADTCIHPTHICPIVRVHTVDLCGTYNVYLKFVLFENYAFLHLLLWTNIQANKQNDIKTIFSRYFWNLQLQHNGQNLWCWYAHKAKKMWKTIHFCNFWLPLLLFFIYYATFSAANREIISVHICMGISVFRN